MQVIKFENKEYNLCTSWSEVTLKQLIRFYTLKLEDDLGSISEIVLNTKILELLCNVPEDTFMDFSTIDTLRNAQYTAKFLQEQPNFIPPGQFMCNNVLYGFRDMNETQNRE